MKKTIANKRVSLEVSSYGAEITSLKLDGFEYLWKADPKYYGRVSPILFPITGRFMDGYYMHNNQKYEMQLNGIVMERNFDIEKVNDNKITCTLVSDIETKKIYPFDFVLKVHYILEETTLKVLFDIKNNSDEIMPYSVGNHTAFKWPLVDGEDASSYFLKFEQKETLKSFNPFGWTADFLINENIRPIYHDFYANYTRSIRDPKSDWIEYTGATCDYVVRIYRKQFPFLANWALPDPQANLVCLEPCVSISSHGPTMFDREGIRSLAPHSTESVSYELLLYRKSEIDN
jgi:galactose mutarotase-like enzyme